MAFANTGVDTVSEGCPTLGTRGRALCLGLGTASIAAIGTVCLFCTGAAGVGSKAISKVSLSTHCTHCSMPVTDTFYYFPNLMLMEPSETRCYPMSPHSPSLPAPAFPDTHSSPFLRPQPLAPVTKPLPCSAQMGHCMSHGCAAGSSTGNPHLLIPLNESSLLNARDNRTRGEDVRRVCKQPGCQLPGLLGRKSSPEEKGLVEPMVAVISATFGVGYSAAAGWLIARVGGGEITGK